MWYSINKKLLLINYMSTIFGVITTILGLLALWFIVVAILSICGAVIKLSLQSPIFWAGIIGGLLVYLCGGRSDSAIWAGIIVGGGIMLVYYIYSIFGSNMIKIVVCSVIGGFIGYLLGGLIILFSIIGLIAGIYVCKK